MQRIVTAEIDLPLGATVDMIFAIAVHQSVPRIAETLTFTVDGVPAPAAELVDASGNRLHSLHAGPGNMQVRYHAVIGHNAPPLDHGPIERISYLRPSRYAESDVVFAQARREFAGLSGLELLAAVRNSVASRLTYASDGTKGTDSAVTTLATGRGVCRDFSHVVIAFLRAMDVPARYAACYAPGLRPMDFHAVAEAYIDGAWHVVDATGLSDRGSLVRIATGRDAADCAWLSYHGGHVGLDRLRPDAWVDERGVRIDPTPDDATMLVSIR